MKLYVERTGVLLHLVTDKFGENDSGSLSLDKTDPLGVDLSDGESVDVKLIKVIKSSKHFSEEELRCHCGCGSCDMDEDFMHTLELIRRDMGIPLHPTSGFRCKQHNTAVGGVSGSKHLDGQAIDLAAVTKEHKTAIVNAALHMPGITRIGLGEDFIHLDNRPGVKGIHMY